MRSEATALDYKNHLETQCEREIRVCLFLLCFNGVHMSTKTKLQVYERNRGMLFSLSDFGSVDSTFNYRNPAEGNEEEGCDDDVTGCPGEDIRRCLSTNRIGTHRYFYPFSKTLPFKYSHLGMEDYEVTKLVLKVINWAMTNQNKAYVQGHEIPIVVPSLEEYMSTPCSIYDTDIVEFETARQVSPSERL